MQSSPASSSVRYPGSTVSTSTSPSSAVAAARSAAASSSARRASRSRAAAAIAADFSSGAASAAAAAAAAASLRAPRASPPRRHLFVRQNHKLTLDSLAFSLAAALAASSAAAATSARSSSVGSAATTRGADVPPSSPPPPRRAARLRGERLRGECARERRGRELASAVRGRECRAARVPRARVPRARCRGRDGPRGREWRARTRALPRAPVRWRGGTSRAARPCRHFALCARPTPTPQRVPRRLFAPPTPRAQPPPPPRRFSPPPPPRRAHTCARGDRLGDVFKPRILRGLVSCGRRLRAVRDPRSRSTLRNRARGRRRPALVVRRTTRTCTPFDPSRRGRRSRGVRPRELAMPARPPPRPARRRGDAIRRVATRDARPPADAPSTRSPSRVKAAALHCGTIPRASAPPARRGHRRLWRRRRLVGARPRRTRASPSRWTPPTVADRPC